MKVLQTTPPGKPAETSSVRERPILFSGEMVRAILAGRKTQTRRIVKPSAGEQAGWLSMESLHGFVKSGEIIDGGWQMWHPKGGPRSPYGWVRCPYGVPGDRLWVKETHAREMQLGTGATRVVYRASMREGYLPGWDQKWKPSIFMPRKWSRITLPITSIRVERLQDISEEDAKAEGVQYNPFDPVCPCEMEADVPGPHLDTCAWRNPAIEPPGGAHRNEFALLWASINGRESWNANPWVWVVGWDKAVLHG